ncbi:MAG: hypothetical protein N3B21_19320 [Clostridia bacterium]|nr:hypothetical protein [Clostridia bacterium]
MAYVAYATKTDLAAFLFTTEDKLPGDSDRLLMRASELIKQATLNNVRSDNTNHTEALKLATCAQVEFWMSAGESSNIEGKVASYSMTDVSINFGDNITKGGQICMRSRAYLNDQGLLYRGIKPYCREVQQA